MASFLAPVCRKMTPIAYENMTAFEDFGSDCRVGRSEGEVRPFSSVTVVSDFCAHAHRDRQNINNGVTMVRS
jgi:hypothetical protein